MTQLDLGPGNPARPEPGGQTMTRKHRAELLKAAALIDEALKIINRVDTAARDLPLGDAAETLTSANDEIREVLLAA